MTAFESTCHFQRIDEQVRDQSERDKFIEFRIALRNARRHCQPAHPSWSEALGSFLAARPDTVVKLNGTLTTGQIPPKRRPGVRGIKIKYP